MVPRETGRRKFLFGAAGVASSAEAGRRASGLGTPAVGVPDLNAEHRIRWEFGVDDERALVYPAATADGAVFVFVNRNQTDAESQSEVHAIDVETGQTRWKSEKGDRPVATSVADGLVYTRGHRRVQALDVTDGSLKWDFELGEKHLREFRVADGTAFVAARRELTALDAADGTERWQVSVGSDPEKEETERVGDYVRGLVVAGDSLYVGSTEGFTAFALADGERRWHVPIDAEVAWPAAVRDGLLVGWSNRTVYGIETADGDARFRTEVGNVRAHSIGGTVGEEAAYVWGERLTAVDLRTGGKRWTYDESDEEELDTREGQGFSPILHDGRVYTSTGHERVVALDADSGRERWQFASEVAFGRWGAVADGFVYVAGTRRVYAFDAETGRQRWSFEVGDRSTAMWVSALGDTVFVGTRKGRLYAIDPPSRLASAPVETAAQFATSSPGLGLLGLLGAGLLGVGYLRAKRRASASGLENPDLELGRLERLGGGPVTETHLKRVGTPDGPRLVAETRLTESADPERRRAFAEAIEEWAELDADGVLPVREYGTDSDTEPRFETPYLAGGSLADSWPLAYRERVEVVSAVARAVHAAHREGVVHGRLAPRHVFRGNPDRENGRGVADPEVRVGGWFLADALAEIRGETAPDPYAPPETRDEADDSVRADVYRVAALAHHLLAGEVPESGSPAVTGLPDELDAVLNRALAADPANRYDSALAFDDEFRWAALDR